MSRRELIRMDEDEVLAFLEEERTVTCATHGPRGWPHLMPLWYVVRDGTIWAWTFAKSQKVRNLERDAHATLQVEAGDTYDQLRGVMLEAEVVLHRDQDDVARLGAEITARYAGTGSAEDYLDVVRAQAPKRVALEFREVGHRATWDHRKLATGIY